MPDVFSREKRSWIMRQVRGADTAPERRVRSWLHRAGFRFRLQRSELPGKPDIVLPRYRTAIFVHGCFWHGHTGCKNAALPASNRPYWEAKIGRNRRRDRRTAEALRALGWQVLTVWECAITAPGRLRRSLGPLLRLRRRGDQAAVSYEE